MVFKKIDFMGMTEREWTCEESHDYDDFRDFDRYPD